jgi:hypothetical protein
MVLDKNAQAYRRIGEFLLALDGEVSVRTLVDTLRVPYTVAYSALRTLKLNGGVKVRRATEEGGKTSLYRVGHRPTLEAYARRSDGQTDPTTAWLLEAAFGMRLPGDHAARRDLG